MFSFSNPKITTKHSKRESNTTPWPISKPLYWSPAKDLVNSIIKNKNMINKLKNTFKYVLLTLFFFITQFYLKFKFFVDISF